MSYIEKEKLIKTDIASIENRVRHAFNQGYNLGFKEGNKRAKPLEQEPKTGHWINTANPRMSDNIVCSECGYDSIADFKFCPNCGSYNGGASNGNE